VGLPAARADAEGQFESGPVQVLPDEDTRLYAQAVDAAGNRSACSSPLVYTHDGVAPGAPRLLRFHPLPPANENAPHLRGQAEPGSRVEVFRSTGCFGDIVAQATVGVGGFFDLPLSLADDVTEFFSVHARDAVGNASSCVRGQLFTEDSTAPALIVFPLVSPRNLNTVDLAGQTEGGATVSLYAEAGCKEASLSATASPEGAFAFRTAVADDSTTHFHFQVRDAAGNSSACTGPATFVEDSTPPSTAAAQVVDGSSEDGDLQQDNTTVQARWSGFSDTPGPLTYEYLLRRGAGCAGTLLQGPLTSASPFLSVSGLTLADGLYTQCVRARDASGNLSAEVGSDGLLIDGAPPQVRSTVPVAEAAEAEPREPVKVVFSEPVDPASVTLESFRLASASGPVPGTVACQAEQCTFTPATPLPYREAFTVTLSTAVRDAHGQALAAPYSFSFTTRGRKWMTPVELSHVRPAYAPDAALDGQGRALAVWAQGGSGSFRAYASRYVPASGWESPRPLDPDAVGEVEAPAVAVGAGGQGTAAWLLRQGEQVDLFAASYAPATGWEMRQALEQRPEPVSGLRLGADAQGRSLVVWRQAEGGVESLWAARHVPGEGWSTPVLLEEEEGAVSVPSLGVWASGAALVAWLQPDSSGAPRVRARRFTPSAGWGPVETASTFASGLSVALSVGGDGSALAGFRYLEHTAAGLIYRLYMVRRTPAGTWDVPERLVSPPNSVGDEFTVVADPRGHALAVWKQFDWQYVARFTPERGWSGEGQPDSYLDSPLGVTTDSNGNFHFAWVEHGNSQYVLTAGHFPEGTVHMAGFQSLHTASKASPKSPRLVANASGDVVLVYTLDNGSGFSGNLVYASTYE
jgi:hypothetical protein